jgi:hypothetical protein
VPATGAAELSIQPAELPPVAIGGHAALAPRRKCARSRWSRLRDLRERCSIELPRRAHGRMPKSACRGEARHRFPHRLSAGALSRAACPVVRTAPAARGIRSGRSPAGPRSCGADNGRAGGSTRPVGPALERAEQLSSRPPRPGRPWQSELATRPSTVSGARHAARRDRAQTISRPGRTRPRRPGCGEFPAPPAGSRPAL